MAKKDTGILAALQKGKAAAAKSPEAAPEAATEFEKALAGPKGGKAAAKTKPQADPEVLAVEGEKNPPHTIAELKKLKPKQLVELAGKLAEGGTDVEWEGDEQDFSKLKKDVMVEAVAKATGVWQVETAAAKAHTGVNPHDQLVKIAKQVESLKTAEDAQEYLQSSMKDEGLTDFKLGGVLTQMNDNGWFCGHPSLKDFASEELGVEYRKMRYLMGNYQAVVDLGIPYESIVKIGWTKLRVMVPILTGENFETWVEFAASNTYATVQKAVEAERKKQAAGAGGGEITAPSTTKTKAFKLHLDQLDVVNEALDVAKSLSGTDVDSVGLTNMALDFMAGHKKKPTKLPTMPVDTSDKGVAAYLKQLREDRGGDAEALAALTEALDGAFKGYDVSITPSQKGGKKPAEPKAPKAPKPAKEKSAKAAKTTKKAKAK